MAKPAPVDLIRLEDVDGNRCIVRVTGRSRPGVLTGHDVLGADVLVSASFVDARLHVDLFPDDLDDWEQALDALVPGGKAGIGGDRGLSLALHMHEENHLWLAVDDPDRLSVLVGISPEGEWIEDHRERLESVRRTWPAEVVEAAPATYQWRRDRAF